MSFFPVSLYIAGFTTSISSTLAATIVLAIFNSSGVIGQIIIGYLSDRFPYPWIMFISTLGSAVAAFLLWGFANTLAQVFAFAILFGGLVSCGLYSTLMGKTLSVSISGGRFFFRRVRSRKRLCQPQPRASPDGHGCIHDCKRCRSDYRTDHLWTTVGSRQIYWNRFRQFLWQIWFRPCGDLRWFLRYSKFCLESCCCRNTSSNVNLSIQRAYFLFKCSHPEGKIRLRRLSVQKNVFDRECSGFKG